MAFVRTAARQMGHGLERVDVSLSLRKWWKLGYTKQNGLVRSGGGVCGWRDGWQREASHSSLYPHHLTPPPPLPPSPLPVPHTDHQDPVPL